MGFSPRHLTNATSPQYTNGAAPPPARFFWDRTNRWTAMLRAACFSMSWPSALAWPVRFWLCHSNSVGVMK
jgi:hypothetical protein